MIRKTLAALVLLPLALIIVIFAVANRQAVTVSFDPFGARDPALSATVPLFVLVLVLTIAGVVIGGVAAWRRQRKWRRAARAARAEASALRAELESLRVRAGVAEHTALPSPSGSALRVVRPPAA
jgi:uncharacterized integral membrane protein